MSPTEFDPRMHQQMGEVLAEIRNLRDAFRQSEIKADNSRATMHQRMDMLVDRVGKVRAMSRPFRRHFRNAACYR
jgi:hypothetical protein